MRRFDGAEASDCSDGGVAVARRFFYVSLGVLSLVAAIGSAEARTWHIVPDGSGDAPTIQAGVVSAGVGDSVSVAPGSYYEHDIVITKAIYLVGDEDNPEHVIVDASGQGSVLRLNNVDNATWIVGLTLRGSPQIGLGGALYCSGASPSVDRCVITESRANFGGGLYCANGSSPIVTECVFRGNYAAQGGAVLLRAASSPTFRGCRFVENSAGSGGAVFAQSSSHPEFADCVFGGNSTTGGAGGGLFCEDAFARVVDSEFFANVSAGDGGGAIFCHNSESIIEDCTFRANESIAGGAVDVVGTSDVGLTRCVFDSNRGAALGGGLRTGSSSTSVVTCVFWRNTTSGSGSAIATEHGANLLVSRSVFVGGTGNGVVACESGGEVVLDCCDAHENLGGDWLSCIAGQQGVNGNFSADPLFCDAAAGDFTLRSDSPCLPGQHPDGYDCGLVGAFGEGCSAPTSVEHTTWGGVKSLFR